MFDMQISHLLITTVLMAVMFYMGFFWGKEKGVEYAMINDIRNELSRLSTKNEGTPFIEKEMAEQVANDLIDKLTNDNLPNNFKAIYLVRSADAKVMQGLVNELRKESNRNIS